MYKKLLFLGLNKGSYYFVASNFSMANPGVIPSLSLTANAEHAMDQIPVKNELG